MTAFLFAVVAEKGGFAPVAYPEEVRSRDLDHLLRDFGYYILSARRYLVLVYLAAGMAAGPRQNTSDFWLSLFSGRSIWLCNLH